MSVTKVVYGLSGFAAGFFGLWQNSLWAGIFLWLAFITLWEMVAYLGERKQ